MFTIFEKEGKTSQSINQSKLAQTLAKAKGLSNDVKGEKGNARCVNQKQNNLFCFSEKIQFKKSLFGYFFSRKSNAFTLAEVLITLGIIGIVAELTTPTLIHNIHEQQYNVCLKEFYSQISQAVTTLQNPDYAYDFTDSTSLQNRDALCNVMSCVKKDTAVNLFGNVSARYADNYVNYKSSNPAYIDLVNADSAAVLKNGMYIGITNYSGGERTYVQLYVDINGGKGPNMFGKDLYLIEITKFDNGKFYPVASGSPNGHYDANGSCKTNQSDFWEVWPCTYYRLYQPDKMP